MKREKHFLLVSTTSRQRLYRQYQYSQRSFLEWYEFCQYAGRMAKKKGRPAKALGHHKALFLQVRVGASEKAAFNAAADLAGLELSAWVRERLRRVARAELEEAGLAVPFVKTS